jgi:hypothetical protein
LTFTIADEHWHRGNERAGFWPSRARTRFKYLGTKLMAHMHIATKVDWRTSGNPIHFAAQAQKVSSVLHKVKI